MDTVGRPELASTRTGLQLLQDQLQGMRAWHAEMRSGLDVKEVAAASREARVDVRRRLEALQRTQAALLSRADASVSASQQLLRTRPSRARAVVVHRNAWLRDKLSLGFRHEGLMVIAQSGDGAEGLGFAIAEQPDLLLVEDRLPLVTGLELVRASRRFVPHSVVVAHVEDSSGAGEMLDAGASAVFSRRIPPTTIAQQVAEFLRARAADPLLLL